MTCASEAHLPPRRSTLLTGIAGITAAGLLSGCTEHPAPIGPCQP